MKPINGKLLLQCSQCGGEPCRWVFPTDAEWEQDELYCPRGLGCARWEQINMEADYDK